jgi:hypothetical protein
MIDRRRFLRGVGGAVVALPYVASLAPRAAWGQGSDQVYTFLMRCGNGVATAFNGEAERFWPSTAGALTTASMNAEPTKATSALAAYADKTLIVRGITHPFDHGNCGHAKGMVQAFTAARFDEHGEGRNTSSRGRSVDWELAAHVNPAGVAPLNLRSGPVAGYFGYDTVIYRGNADKVDGDTNPYAVYQRMFGLGDVDETTQQRLAARRTSVNDLVRDEMRELMGKAQLGTADRARLDRHFTAIRDLEVRMTTQLDADKVDAMEQMVANATANDNRITVAKMHMDIAALAFAADINRVATLQIGSSNDKTRYRINGTLYEDFHHISHRINSDGSDGTAIVDAARKHGDIDRLFMETFRYMVEQLDGHGILDKSLCYWTNDLAHGNAHSGQNGSGQFLPQVFVGGANGALRTGRYLNVGRVINNRLLSTILAAAGARNPDGSNINFGDSSLAAGVIADMLT